MHNSSVIKICRASLVAILISTCFSKAFSCQVPAKQSPFIVKVEPPLENFDVVLEVVVDKIYNAGSPENAPLDEDFAQISFKITRSVKGQILFDRIDSIIFRTMCAPPPIVGEQGFIAGKLTTINGKIFLRIATVL